MANTGVRPRVCVCVCVCVRVICRRASHFGRIGDLFFLCLFVCTCSVLFRRSSHKSLFLFIYSSVERRKKDHEKRERGPLKTAVVGFVCVEDTHTSAWRAREGEALRWFTMKARNCCISKRGKNLLRLLLLDPYSKDTLPILKLQSPWTTLVLCWHTPLNNFVVAERYCS